MAAPTPGVWGIDLGQCALKAIRLQLVEGKVEATAFDYIEHPKILSQPDADPDQLAREALEKFLERNTVTGDTIAISVPGQSGLARFVKLPPVEEKKINDIVRFEAKQQIPFPLEEVVWDFQKIGAGVVTDGFAMETEIGLFAMKRDMILRALQQFRDVNVEVHIVQMAPLALCNFVAYDLLGKDAEPKPRGDDEEEPEDEDDEHPGKKRCIVALDIGVDSSNLVITDGEKIIWQRPIPLGGNHFTRALTKDLKLTFAKAEHVKRNAIKSPDLRKILGALRPVLNDFVSEVQRSLGYFANTHRDAYVKYMLGLGNAFRLPGLQKFLQEKLQLEVRKLNELQRLEGEDVKGAPQFTENVLSFAVAHGLALQGLKMARIQTTLLPAEIRTERLIRAKKPWAVATAAALLLAVAGLTFARGFEHNAVANSDVEAALKQASAIQAVVKKHEDDFAAKMKESDESRDSVNRIAAGVEERFNWNLIYKYINNAVPQPNGGRLAARTRAGNLCKNDYYDAIYKRSVGEDLQDWPVSGKEAYQKFLERQTPQANAAPKDLRAQKLDNLYRQHLVQINIEGINCLYSDDLSVFFQSLAEDKNQKLRGMLRAERDLIQSGDKEKLPKNGWVFEVRGYTYHHAAEEFIERTIVENLAHPDGIKADLADALSTDLKDRVGKHAKFVMLYESRRVKDPDPSAMVIAQSNWIKALLPEAKAADPSQSGNTPAAPMGTPPPGGTTPPPGGTTPPPMGSAIATSVPSTGAGAATGQGADAAKAVSRELWQPLGDIAGATFASLGGASSGSSSSRGSGVSKQPVVPSSVQPMGQTGTTELAQEPPPPRTEFIIVFVWTEPTTLDRPAGAAGATGATTPPQ